MQLLEGDAAIYSPVWRQQSKMWATSEFWLILYLGACDPKYGPKSEFWLIAYLGARDTKMCSKSEFFGSVPTCLGARDTKCGLLGWKYLSVWVIRYRILKLR